MTDKEANDVLREVSRDLYHNEGHLSLAAAIRLADGSLERAWQVATDDALMFQVITYSRIKADGEMFLCNAPAGHPHAGLCPGCCALIRGRHPTVTLEDVVARCGVTARALLARCP